MKNHSRFPGQVLLTSEELERRESHVIGESTAYAIETERMNDLVNNATTLSGKYLVGYSLRNPSTSKPLLEERQQALRELVSNDKLVQGAEDFLERFSRQEYETASFLGYAMGSSGSYTDHESMRQLVSGMPRWAEEMPVPESALLQRLRNDIISVRGTPIHKLSQGIVWHQWFRKGVYSTSELKAYSPMFPFTNVPAKLSRILPSMALGASIFLGRVVGETMSPETTAFAGAMSAFGLLGGAAGGYMWGRISDDLVFIGPLKTRYEEDEPLRTAFDSVAELDALLSYDKFRRKLKHATLPRLVDSPRHFFRASGLVNAIQSQQIDNYTPNDVEFGAGQRLTFITGPNSGGKTSLGKSLTQAQQLGQSACWIPADDAEMTIADRIFYQVGTNDSLEDSEGGLGAQLEQTKEILFSGTPQSLAVVDDLIEGTTFREKTEQSTDMLCAMVHKGLNVVYISHHYELAQAFEAQGVGNFIQVEFNGVEPTHRMIPGISTNSHADLVANRVGFGRGDMVKHLVEGGFLPKGTDLRDLSAYAKVAN